MTFIFPKNYNFKPKFLGIIDYSTAILDSAIGLFIYFIINTLIYSIILKISIFISLFLPVILLSIIGIKNESFISVFCYMIKFIKNQNVYLYNKK